MTKNGVLEGRVKMDRDFEEGAAIYGIAQKSWAFLGLLGVFPVTYRKGTVSISAETFERFGFLFDCLIGLMKRALDTRRWYTSLDCLE